MKNYIVWIPLLIKEDAARVSNHLLNHGFAVQPSSSKGNVLADEDDGQKIGGVYSVFITTDKWGTEQKIHQVIKNIMDMNSIKHHGIIVSINGSNAIWCGSNIPLTSIVESTGSAYRDPPNVT